jgi:hypothetical protein
MSRLITAVAITAALAGCDGTNPFMLEATAPTGETEALDENDPNTSVDSKFAFDPAASLTMNSVVYDDNGTPNDPTDDDLIINNLPFDGPAGRYDAVAGTQTVSPTGLTTGIYESRQTATTGQIKHYAVFLQGDYTDATSAAGRDWGNFGNAGANINRSDFNLPSSNEYVYVGVYAGTRTYAERSGLELITGDVRLLLDIDDFDVNFPGDGLQGDIIGSVTNRIRQPTSDTMVGDLPNITLFEVSFDTETGVWEDGRVETYNSKGDVRDQGLHEGLIAGPNGEEMGGYLVMEGVADIQTVTYEIVEWEIVTTDGNPPRTGTVNGLQISDPDFLQGLVNFGIDVGLLEVEDSDLPDGATRKGSTTTRTEPIAAEYNAREIGVFVADQE